MSIAASLAAEPEHTTKKPCGTARWIAAQPQADRDSISEWLAAGRSKIQLHRVLVANGFPYSSSALNMHANNTCPCP